MLLCCLRNTVNTDINKTYREAETQTPLVELVSVSGVPGVAGQNVYNDIGTIVKS